MINAIQTDMDECWAKLTVLSMFRRHLMFHFSGGDLKRVLVAQAGPGAVPRRVDVGTPGKPRRPRTIRGELEEPPPEIQDLIINVESFCATDIEFRNILRTFACFKFDVTLTLDGDNLIGYKVGEV